MKIEVGMYVRTERGKIWLVTSTKAIDGHKRRIVKADYNILKLIQVGDYVNGYPVYEILEYKDNTSAIVIGDDNKSIIWEESSQYIKSIVTKEQFEQMQYKVGE